MTEIRIKRGLLAQLPADAADGEPLFTKDRPNLYIGAGPGVSPVKVTGVTAEIQEALADKVNRSELGTAAAKNAPVTGNASTVQVVMGSDTRLANSRTPNAHNFTHAAGGTDAIPPADIGAATQSQGLKADSALQPDGDGSSLVGLTKVQVGLGNVDNTSDANKPISLAAQAGLDAKANTSDLSWVSCTSLGVSPDIGSDVTSSINSAIAFLSSNGGAVLHFPKGTYIAQGIQLKSNVVVDGDNAIFQKAGVGASTHVIEAIGTDTTTSSVLSSNCANGSNSVSVVSASGFSTGDSVLIYDNTYQYGAYGRNQEIKRVLSISGNTVTLTSAVTSAYNTSATATLVKLSVVENAVVRGIKLLNTSTVSTSGGLFYGVLCSNVRIEDCEAIGPADDAGFQFEQSAQCLVIKCKVRNGLNMLTGGYGYGIMFNESCSDCVAVECDTENIRENLITNGCRRTGYFKCTAHSPIDDGFNTHGSGNSDCFIVGCTVINSGGVGISVGYGTDNAPDTNIAVTGNTIIGSQGNGINIVANSGGAYRHSAQITGNVIRGFGLNAGTATAIYLNTVEGSTVSGNYITSPSNGSGTAIAVAYARYTDVSNNIVYNAPNAIPITWLQCAYSSIADNKLYFATVNPLKSVGGINTQLSVRDNYVHTIKSSPSFIWNGDEIHYGNSINNVVEPTTSLGTLPSYASNAAAITGGLTVGTPYRQGDFVAVVH